MKNIIDLKLNSSQAAIWFLGQAGYIIKSCDAIITIDPYLSDSVEKKSPALKRTFPAPIKPADLKADIFIVTHDHLDHLDPQTIGDYKYKNSTMFVAPRFASKALKGLGIKNQNITTIDVGESKAVGKITIEGVYTVPSEPKVIDTAGYLIKFPNGRCVYHSSDTELSALLMQAAGQAEVGLFCINGKWGNMNAENAAQLAAKVCTKFAIPNHYDLFALNSENPEIFKYSVKCIKPELKVEILELMKPFIWD
jgi:L-ascorbate 6-phosphate lactonase